MFRQVLLTIMFLATFGAAGLVALNTANAQWGWGYPRYGYYYAGAPYNQPGGPPYYQGYGPPYYPGYGPPYTAGVPYVLPGGGAQFLEY